MKTPIKLITPDRLAEKGIATTLDHLRRLWKAGEFPAPIHLSERKLAWYETEIDRWIESRARARTAA